MGIPVFTVRREFHRESTYYQNEIVYTGAQSILPLIKHELRGVCQEHHACITLDHAHRVTGFATTGIGSTTSVGASPKEFFRYALANDASYAVAIHTHPGQWAHPSEPDRVSYKVLSDAGMILGIPLADDIILAESGRHFSFSEESSRQYRRKQAQIRNRLVAKARRSVAAGGGSSREIVLLAAADLSTLLDLPSLEQVELIDTLIATLSPITATDRRIWRGTRQRAQSLLIFLEQIRPGIQAGEFPDLGRLSEVLGFDASTPAKQPTFTALPEFYPLPRELEFAAVGRSKRSNHEQAEN